MERIFQRGEEKLEVRATRDGGALRLETASGVVEFLWEELAPGDYLLRHGAEQHRCLVARQGAERWLWIDGRVHHLHVKEAGRRHDDAHAGDLQAPMPGQVLAIHVAPGERVTRNQPLVLMEAMKMQVEIVATRDGVVAEVKARAGEQVPGGAILVVLGEDGAP